MMDDIDATDSTAEPPDLPLGGAQPPPPWPDDSGPYAAPIGRSAQQGHVEPDHAAPFSVAVGTVAGMAGVRALRDTWRRHRSAARSAGPDAGAAGEPGPPSPAADLAPGKEREPESMGPLPDTSAGLPRSPFASEHRDHDAALVEERAAMVHLCIELDDLLTNDALRQKLRRGLRRVGVTVEVPEAVPFDADRHRAVGTAPAPDPMLVGTIASVERPGFADAGEQLRPPDVIVYTAKGEDHE